ncbi:LOW QUALITY PROTEIN: uncharacterized protein RG961_009505 [Leptosomus discolor]
MAAAAGAGADGGSSGEEDDGGGPAGESRCLAACRACGVTPASGLPRQPPGPALSLRHRGLGPRGAKALALSLMVNTSVLTLDLRDNWLQGEGPAAIAEMLKENCYISAVDLSDNKLGVEGAKALSAMLLEDSVASLQLAGNDFDDHAAEYLADAVTANSKVEILSYRFGGKAGKLAGLGTSRRCCPVRQGDTSLRRQLVQAGAKTHAGFCRSPSGELAGGGAVVALARGRNTAAGILGMKRGAYLILWLYLQEEEEGRIAGDNERITYSQP